MDSERYLFYVYIDNSSMVVRITAVVCGDKYKLHKLILL